MDECDEGNILEVDTEKQPDAQDRLDRTRDVHPGCGRLEARFDEELQRRRHGDLANDMGNKENRADNAQDVEFVEQVELVGKRHAVVPQGTRTTGVKIALLDACANPSCAPYSLRPVSQASPLA